MSRTKKKFVVKNIKKGEKIVVRPFTLIKFSSYPKVYFLLQHKNKNGKDEKGKKD